MEVTYVLLRFSWGMTLYFEGKYPLVNAHKEVKEIA